MTAIDKLDLLRAALGVQDIPTVLADTHRQAIKVAIEEIEGLRRDLVKCRGEVVRLTNERNYYRGDDIVAGA